MSDKLTLEEIRQYWTQQAAEYKQSPKVSWSDERVIQLEIREILKYLQDGDSVLDVGCANAFSTFQFASAKKIRACGVDFVPEMIEEARARLTRVPQGELKGSLEFSVGNILSLDEKDASYDKIIVIRVLINLQKWENQKSALQECIRVLKPGGTLLLSEATLQGYRKLNHFRNEWGLPDIGIPSFNEYLDEEQVIEAAKPNLELIEVVNFASTYYVGTRVFKPLLCKLLNKEDIIANPQSEWNRWFSQLPAFGDYGTQKLFVFKKRSK